MKRVVDKEFAKLPKGTQNKYRDENAAIKLDELLAASKKPETLTMLENGCNLHSKELFPALYAALDKYTLTQTFRKILDSNDTDTQKVNNFKQTFEKPVNKAILNAYREQASLNFLQIIGHILSLGLYSKMTKDTFAFWKSSEIVITETMASTVKRAAAAAA